MSIRAESPIPQGLHTVTPQLWFNGNAREAVEFYQKAFNAKLEEEMDIAPDGKVMHARLHIGDSVIFVADTMGSGYSRGPESFATTAFYLYVSDCDSLFHRATYAGCTVTMPLQDMFWGDRVGEVRDLYGHCWSIATNKLILAPQEMKKAEEEWFEKQRTVGA